MVTTDKNIRYQQNLEGRKLALIVLVTARIVAAVDVAVPEQLDRAILMCLAKEPAGRPSSKRSSGPDP